MTTYQVPSPQPSEHSTANTDGSELRLLYVPFRGWTASPRQPRILSGNAVVMPVPSHSMLLGLIGCCLGRLVSSSEVRIGFEYHADDVINADLETTHRLEFDGKTIKPNAKGTAIKSREFHAQPRLSLFVDRTDWREFFESPVGIPCLGQSQDLLWSDLRSIQEVTAVPVSEGHFGHTLIPGLHTSMPGRILRLVESYDDQASTPQQGRIPRASGCFTAIHSLPRPTPFSNLYQVGDLLGGRVLYLHSWISR